uniref:50S ribosomal protein L21, chloroplastic n=1 Tax=Choreocolax polysiphoniae TaxID=282351 RepID=A0A0B5W3B3_9FLOR|nr:50S ribosomal protein L21 [Choreocolax polysiphoniae]AJH65880.1 50S ribosomal protein L21 [Choreocolax polysiphoniae]
MVYAIVDVGGNQIFIEPKKIYDINYISANPGDIINFKRVLFIFYSYYFKIGTPCLNNVLIKTKILRHLYGKKLIAFKIKSKKNFRLKKGHRQKLTRIFIEDIALL